MEILIIFLIILLLFGSKKLPELFRSIGQSMKEFKKATSDVQDSIQRSMDEGEKQADGVDKRERRAEQASGEVAKEVNSEKS